MTRIDDDSWDLASGVGATATMVAAARAVASSWPDSFADDHYAAGLVRSVGVDVFSRLVSGGLSFAEIGDGGSAWMPYVFGIRANHFDRFWSSAASTGIRQIVNLASGLDSRGYRLPTPPGTVVYEVDIPQVIAFKQTVLTDMGAVQNAEIRSVGVDLRDDWPAALQAAGFDAATPTAWLAEGLMIGFLPGEAQDRMLDNVTRLSAAGSMFAADHVRGRFTVLGEQVSHIGESWRAQGLDVDFASLYYTGEHHDVETYLQGIGWQTTGATIADLFSVAGVPKPALEFGSGVEGVVYVTAAKQI
jgi:methyltransferase (TIGR00027 family)